MEYKIKKDHYRKVRGGKSTVLDISCSNCNDVVLIYQKDGDGGLLRCYINRIFSPDIYVTMNNDPRISEPKDLPNLICGKCGSLIGVPMRHSDGRLAFRLRRGAFKKSKNQKGDQND